MALLGGTTALLLLYVFTVVNIALIVIRRRPAEKEHPHFTAPTVLPYVEAITCAFLAGPWARSEEQQEQYVIAGFLLAAGIVLWVLTWATNRGIRAKKTGFRDIDHLDQ